MLPKGICSRFKPHITRTKQGEKNALLPRMWRRNAIHASYKTLRLQKLRTITNTSRTHRIKRTIATLNGDRRRTKAKKTPRIPEVVAQQQEKIA